MRSSDHDCGGAGFFRRADMTITATIARITGTMASQIQLGRRLGVGLGAGVDPGFPGCSHP